ncbi:hypothetical protein ZIOFF_045787 [Zingiber officinale]|uniref:Uncharacterized protein n=1 Tax=Zingiber officinale TaxID=94328 RepID=A0A8J5G1L0_ZINOF|nr:hypothetical protein ZIOFF_045787 [Zingiber officinale]
MRARPESDSCPSHPLPIAPYVPRPSNIDLSIALRKEVPTIYFEAYQHSAWQTTMDGKCLPLSLVVLGS